MAAEPATSALSTPRSVSFAPAAAESPSPKLLASSPRSSPRGQRTGLLESTLTVSSRIVTGAAGALVQAPVSAAGCAAVQAVTSAASAVEDVASCGVSAATTVARSGAAAVGIASLGMSKAATRLKALVEGPSHDEFGGLGARLPAYPHPATRYGKKVERARVKEVAIAAKLVRKEGGSVSQIVPAWQQARSRMKLVQASTKSLQDAQGGSSSLPPIARDQRGRLVSPRGEPTIPNLIPGERAARRFSTAQVNAQANREKRQREEAEARAASSSPTRRKGSTSERRDTDSSTSPGRKDSWKKDSPRVRVVR